MGERVVLKRLRSHLRSVLLHEYLCRDPGGWGSPPGEAMFWDAANARSAAAMHVCGWSSGSQPATVGVEVSADGGTTWAMHRVTLQPKPWRAVTR